MSLLPNPEIFNTKKETLPNPKTGKSQIQFTTFENAKRLFGIDTNSIVGIPGQQSRAVECSLTPNSVAKIGKGSDLFTEAVCLALLNNPSTEIVIAPTAKVDVRNANEICIIVPRVTGLSFEQELAIIRKKRLRVQPEKILIDDLNKRSVGIIAKAISSAERRKVVLNDIQKRQVVLNLDETKSGFVDYTAARVGWYDQESIMAWINLLDNIGNSNYEVSKYGRDLVAKHLLKLTKELSIAQGLPISEIDLSQIDHEIVQWQAELLLRKTAINLPKDERTVLDRLASDIDYAKPPTPINTIKDFIFGSYRTEEWKKLPDNIRESIEIARKFLDESNLLSWMQENPEEFSEAMLKNIKQAFLSFEGLSINRAFDIEGNGGWGDIKNTLKELATVKGLTKPVGERRRAVVSKLKQEVIHLCVASDRSVADGITNDLLLLRDIMVRDNIPGTSVFADQIGYLCDFRKELVAKLESLSSRSENNLEEYLHLSRLINQALNRITKIIEARSGGEVIRALPR